MSRRSGLTAFIATRLTVEDVSHYALLYSTVSKQETGERTSVSRYLCRPSTAVSPSLENTRARVRNDAGSNANTKKRNQAARTANKGGRTAQMEDAPRAQVAHSQDLAPNKHPLNLMSP